MPPAGKVIVAVGAVVSITHVDEAVALALAAASTARTWNVWLPWATPLYAFGLVQAANPPPSRSHSKVTPASVSLHMKLAAVWLVGVPGPPPTVGAPRAPLLLPY